MVKNMDSCVSEAVCTCRILWHLWHVPGCRLYFCSTWHLLLPTPSPSHAPGPHIQPGTHGGSHVGFRSSCWYDKRVKTTKEKLNPLCISWNNFNPYIGHACNGIFFSKTWHFHDIFILNKGGSDDLVKVKMAKSHNDCNRLQASKALKTLNLIPVLLVHLCFYWFLQCNNQCDSIKQEEKDLTAKIF